MKEGQEYKALLDYAEAYHIFSDFDNQRQMGICLSNMAAIRFQINEYKLACYRFNQSAQFMSREIA